MLHVDIHVTIMHVNIFISDVDTFDGKITCTYGAEECHHSLQTTVVNSFFSIHVFYAYVFAKSLIVFGKKKKGGSGESFRFT